MNKKLLLLLSLTTFLAVQANEVTTYYPNTNIDEMSDEEFDVVLEAFKKRLGVWDCDQSEQATTSTSSQKEPSKSKKEKKAKKVSPLVAFNQRLEEIRTSVQKLKALDSSATNEELSTREVTLQEVRNSLSTLTKDIQYTKGSDSILKSIRNLNPTVSSLETNIKTIKGEHTVRVRELAHKERLESKARVDKLTETLEQEAAKKRAKQTVSLVEQRLTINPRLQKTLIAHLNALHSQVLEDTTSYTQDEILPIYANDIKIINQEILEILNSMNQYSIYELLRKLYDVDLSTYFVNDRHEFFNSDYSLLYIAVSNLKTIAQKQGYDINTTLVSPVILEKLTEIYRMVKEKYGNERFTESAIVRFEKSKIL